MGEHIPTIDVDRDGDGSLAGGGGNSQALDADLLPEEFPDERPWAVRDYGVTEAEQARRESLARRLRREEPELPPADLDGEGPDSAAEDSFDADTDDSPDLLSNDDEEGHDLVKELVTERCRPERHPDDSGQPGSPRSAEEDAIHVVDGDRDDLED